MAYDQRTVPIKHDPSLSDTILAMDIADTIRRDDRMRDFELADGDRREALIVRLREAYAAQGDVVSDDVLKKAIEKMNEDRYVHRQSVTGLSAWLWGAYINRGAYARRTLLATAAVAAVSVGGVIGYDRLVTQPRIEMEREIAHKLEVVLPRALEAAESYARQQAERLGDNRATMEIEKHVSDGRYAIDTGDFRVAEWSVKAIEKVGDDLLLAENRATEEAAATERREREERSRAETKARLTAELPSMTSSLLAETTDPKAHAALSEIASQMKEAALQGDEALFNAKYDRFKSFAGYIRSPYSIRIVSRNGIQTGFSRTHDQSGSKTWYIVVEAISPTGDVYPLEITDRLLNGPKKITPVWAIRVSDRVIDAVKRDKRDGVIDNNIAGVKPAGKLDIDWKIDAFDGYTLNTW